MEELAPAGAEVTEDDWSTARISDQADRLPQAVGIGVLVGPLIGLLAVYLTSLFASGGARYPVTGPLDDGARRAPGHRSCRCAA